MSHQLRTAEVVREEILSTIIDALSPNTYQPLDAMTVRTLRLLVCELYTIEHQLCPSCLGQRYIPVFHDSFFGPVHFGNFKPCPDCTPSTEAS
jgi:hypothetical protein